MAVASQTHPNWAADQSLGALWIVLCWVQFEKNSDADQGKVALGRFLAQKCH